MNGTDAKREEHDNWTRMAPGFGKHQAFLRRCTAPVSERMLDLCAVGAGSRVLDIACGAGDPALPAAERVGPTGTVLATDFAEDMVAVAREEAARAGITNIDFRVVDGETLDVGTGAFDAVTLRFGLMFMPDAIACLRGASRALRSGGRIAVACWADPERNDWWTLAGNVVRRHAGLPPPVAGEPGAFRFADPSALSATLEQAGFRGVEIDTVDVAFGPYPDPDTWWQTMLDLRGAAVVLLDSLPSTTRAAATREILDAATAHMRPGGIVLGGSAWVASGRK